MARLNQRAEGTRRLAVLLLVPALLERHLRPLLGVRRFFFMYRLLWRAKKYQRQFHRPSDDSLMDEVKGRFLLLGVLYNELFARFGQDAALRTTQVVAYDLACTVQRNAYFPPRAADRTWDYFHAQHEEQMKEGFIRANENDGVHRSAGRVELHIVRCRFAECFRDMGDVRITQAFCRSDETVFNEYSPLMRFTRGGANPDTIARGAQRCMFVYEQIGAG